MIIATNTLAINAHRNLKSVGGKTATASLRLSSGMRINSAADDAAGLAISEKMKAQIRGMKQAQQNVEDGISLIKTMDGGMDGIQDMMIRQRELIVQAINDTNTDEDRAKIQLEIDQLAAEIDATANRVKFNNIPLLNVPSEGYWEPGSSVNVTLPPGAPFPNASTATPGYGYIDVPAGATFTVQVQVPPGSVTGNWPDLIIYSPNGEKFGYGQGGYFAGGNVGTVSPSAADSVQYTGINSISAYPHIESFTITNVSADGAGKWMVGMSNAGGAVPISFNLSIQNSSHALVIRPHQTEDVFVPGDPLWIQCGANSGQGMSIDRYDCRTEGLYKNLFDPSTITIDVNGTPKEITLTKLVTNPLENATASLKALDAAFGKVNEYRGKVGAQQNRLEFTENSLGVSYTNLEDANSRIADADMAKEMMNFTKTNILQQSGMAILAQANQSAQNVLQLLK